MVRPERSVCLFCGSRPGRDPAFAAAARALGAGIAERGWRLVYGGGEVGLMGIAARAALDAGGKVTGIIPHHLLVREVGKPDLDELVVTATMFERKEQMLARSDAFVTLPGGFGTLDELLEVLTLKQLGQLDKPLLLVDVAGAWDALLAAFAAIVDAGFADPGTLALSQTVQGTAAALDRLDVLLA